MHFTFQFKYISAGPLKGKQKLHLYLYSFVFLEQILDID